MVDISGSSLCHCENKAGQSSEKIPSPAMGGGYKRVALVYPTLYLARDVRVKFPPSNSLPPGEGRLFCVFSLST